MATITDLEKQFYELYIATPPAAINDLKYAFFLAMLAGGASFTPTIVTEAGTTRTLSAADGGTIIYCTSSSAVTITTAAGLGAGFNCTIIQGGTGKVTVAQGTSTTLVSYSSLFSTMGQYAVISLVTPVADTFIAAGNLGV
jgi:hypothetical protein